MHALKLRKRHKREYARSISVVVYVQVCVGECYIIIKVSHIDSIIMYVQNSQVGPGPTMPGRGYATGGILGTFWPEEGLSVCERLLIVWRWCYSTHARSGFCHCGRGMGMSWCAFQCCCGCVVILALCVNFQ